MASIGTSIDEWSISVDLEGSDSDQSVLLFLNLHEKTAKKKTRGICIKKADDSAKSRIGSFSNTSLEFHYYTNPFGSNVGD
jgi:hypothetical protein